MDDQRKIDIMKLGEHLADALILANQYHDTRELAIVRTDLQKVISYYMFYVFCKETGTSFEVNP